jgi:GDP-L-fucose synthase
MKILVTGGTGLVGKALQEEAVDYDHDITYLSSSDCNLLDAVNFQDWLDSTQPDAVIHLAANVGGLFKNMSQPIRMFEANMAMNMNVVSSCSNFGVRKFVGMLSTCIFPNDTTYPISEDMIHDGAPHDSNYGYAHAKRMLDIHCRVNRDQHGLDYSCIIPTNIYGENDNYHLEDAHVIPALIHKCHIAKQLGKPFMVAGTGKPLRQFIYAGDLARSILSIVEGSHGNVIVSPSEEHSIGDIARIIAGQFGYADNLFFDSDQSDGQFKKTADNSKFLSICPEFKFTDIDSGLIKNISYFIDNFESVRK